MHALEALCTDHKAIDTSRMYLTLEIDYHVRLRLYMFRAASHSWRSSMSYQREYRCDT